MTPDLPKELDVVALTENIPSEGLLRGQVGTIVHVHDPRTFEVEFSDESGRAFAMAPLHAHQFIILRYKPSQVA